MRYYVMIFRFRFVISSIGLPPGNQKLLCTNRHLCASISRWVLHLRLQSFVSPDDVGTFCTRQRREREGGGRQTDRNRDRRTDRDAQQHSVRKSFSSSLPLRSMGPIFTCSDQKIIHPLLACLSFTQSTTLAFWAN